MAQVITQLYSIILPKFCIMLYIQGNWRAAWCMVVGEPAWAKMRVYTYIYI